MKTFILGYVEGDKINQDNPRHLKAFKSRMHAFNNAVQWLKIEAEKFYVCKIKIPHRTR